MRNVSWLMDTCVHLAPRNIAPLRMSAYQVGSVHGTRVRRAHIDTGQVQATGGHPSRGPKSIVKLGSVAED